MSMTSLHRSHGVRAWAIGLAAAAMSMACAKTPLVPPATMPAPRAELTKPVVVAPPVAPAASAAWTQPVASGQPPIAALAQTSPVAPYGPQVAARFPDPAVNYRTPAFEPGRTTFTSNVELQALLRSLVREGRNTPDATTVKLIPLGTSQAGVPLEALLFTRSADPEAAALARAGRPTVLLVGQQHGDEPAGSEALMVIAQELAHGKLQSLLDRINVVILPRANPDGAKTGTRMTASGIDANRDHLLLRTPEAQAQALLAREFRPAVVVDAHEYPVVGRYLQKFGTVPRFDALVQYAMTANLPELLNKAAEEWFRQPMLASLKSDGLSAEWYYTTSTDINDKKVSMGDARPDNGRNANGLKNAISFLIETRGVGLRRLHFTRRVHTHVVAATSVLHSAAARSDDLVKLRQFIDNEVSALACQSEAVLDVEATPSEYVLQMLDPATGGDKNVTVAWDSSLELRPLKTRARPCGYWLAADQTDAVRRLRGLGVIVQQLTEKGVMRGETFRQASRPSGARHDVRGTIADAGDVLLVQVSTTPTLIDVAPGSYYVPMDQPLANLALAALEPDTQSSFVAHGIIGSVDAEARVMLRPDMKMAVVP